MSEKKRWIITVALSVLAAAGSGVLIYFQHQSIKKRRDEAAVLRGTIEDHRALIQKTPELVKEVIGKLGENITIGEFSRIQIG